MEEQPRASLKHDDDGAMPPNEKRLHQTCG